MSLTDIALKATPIYLAILIFIYKGLALRVIYLRRLYRVGIGSGSKPELKRAIRVHGNFQEYVPLALITILSLELMGTHAYWLHGLGSTLILGRLLHAIGLSNFAGSSFGRFTGSALTYGVMLVGSVLMLVKLCS